MKVRTPLLVALAALSASTLAFADSGGLMRDHETTTELCGVGNYLFRSETGCQTNPSNIARTEPETHIADRTASRS